MLIKKYIHDQQPLNFNNFCRSSTSSWLQPWRSSSQ